MGELGRDCSSCWSNSASSIPCCRELAAWHRLAQRPLPAHHLPCAAAVPCLGHGPARDQPRGVPAVRGAGRHPRHAQARGVLRGAAAGAAEGHCRPGGCVCVRLQPGFCVHVCVRGSVSFFMRIPYRVFACFCFFEAWNMPACLRWLCVCSGPALPTPFAAHNLWLVPAF